MAQAPTNLSSLRCGGGLVAAVALISASVLMLSRYPSWANRDKVLAKRFSDIRTELEDLRAIADKLREPPYIYVPEDLPGNARELLRKARCHMLWKAEKVVKVEAWEFEVSGVNYFRKGYAYLKEAPSDKALRTSLEGIEDRYTGENGCWYRPIKGNWYLYAEWEIHSD